ncbi:hypothetical protein ACTXT7_005219 [Hymenolepis weldensis]
MSSELSSLNVFTPLLPSRREYSSSKLSRNSFTYCSDLLASILVNARDATQLGLVCLRINIGDLGVIKQISFANSRIATNLK